MKSTSLCKREVSVRKGYMCKQLFLNSHDLHQTLFCSVEGETKGRL